MVKCLAACCMREGIFPVKLSALFQEQKRTLSFEVFPPKADTTLTEVEKAASAIAAIRPAFMSVTYGAGGGTSRYTLPLAKRLEADFGVPVLAHLTCVSSTEEALLEQIDALIDAGIENVMALRGDVPEELSDKKDSWHYRHACELVSLLKARGDFCIGGACYPEGHSESATQKEDIARLKEKVDAGCDFLTTQMFFDNHLLYNFLYKIREAGIGVPVVAGIMPITNAGWIKRAIRLSGSFMPQRFKSLVDAFGASPVAMRQAGIAYATDQIIDLYANGIRHVHVYSMNKPEVAAAILSNVSALLDA